MNKSQQGFTLLELAAVLGILAIIASFLVPVIFEPIRNAKIEGGIEQAKGILASCDLARVKPVASVRAANGVTVTNTYRSDYNSWTNASTLQTILGAGHKMATTNPFGRPYLFKMSSAGCLVALELDSLIDGWAGYQTEVQGGRTRIIVGSSNRKSSVAPEWVRHQKRILSGETFR